MTADLNFVMTADDAAVRLDRVRTHVEQAWDDLIALHSGRAWFALGYESWDALCDGELGGARIALPREDRREVVGQMREAGMSIPAIASATGASIGTIHNDLSELKGSGRDLPTAVTGLDGKARPAKITMTSRTTETTKVEHDVDLDTGEILTRADAVTRFPVLDVPGAADDAVIDIATQVLTHPEDRQDYRAEQGAKWLAAQARNQGQPRDEQQTPIASAHFHRLAETVVLLDRHATAMAEAYRAADPLRREQWVGAVDSLLDRLTALSVQMSAATTLRSVK